MTPTILAMRVDERIGDSGQPQIYAVLDRAPEGFVFDEYPQAEKPVVGSTDGRSFVPTDYIGWSKGDGPWAKHFSVTANQRGLGGAEFTLTMRDGSTRHIKEPWIGSGIILANTGVATVSVDYRVLADDEHIHLGWATRWERLRKLLSMVDELTARSEESRRAYANDRYFAADRLETKHRNVLYSEGRRDLEREWENTTEQRAFLAELLLWESGMWTGGKAAISYVRPALEQFCPEWTLYPRRWKPDGLDLGPNVPWWVPARKSKTLTDGDDTPAPKSEGFWGYAVHDEHGYPKTAFYETVRELAADLESYDSEVVENLLNGGPDGPWSVGMRYEGKWSTISRNQQATVRAACRSFA